MLCFFEHNMICRDLRPQAWIPHGRFIQRKSQAGPLPSSLFPNCYPTLSSLEKRWFSRLNKFEAVKVQHKADPLPCESWPRRWLPGVPQGWRIWQVQCTSTRLTPSRALATHTTGYGRLEDIVPLNDDENDGMRGSFVALLRFGFTRDILLLMGLVYVSGIM